MPAWLGALPAAIHGAVVRSRNRRFDRGLGVVTLDRPVISVGNLSVGGTGKTPLTLQLLRWLVDAGLGPAIAMRGYGDPGGRESDEAKLYLRAFPDLPLVAQPDRLGGLLQLFATPQGDAARCVVLDDGFQHRRIARQSDIVVIDATRPPHRDRLLPAGWLREPIESVRRATAVVITHVSRVGAADVADIKREVVAAGGPGVVADCDHLWTDVAVSAAGGETVHDTSWLAGKRVVAVCAIGNPTSFLDNLRGVGASIHAELVLPDHDPFAPQTLSRLLAEAGAAGVHAVVCTEKDWSKLSRVRPELWPCPVARPRLGLRFLGGESELKAHVIAAAGLEIA
jgi:tetraacyldisaccharide 4'-kinase